MFKLAGDASLDGPFYRALLLRRPGLDIVHVQDVGMRTAADPVILEWAAREGRILLTHDRRTMSRFAYERVRAGEAMPGVIVIRNRPDQIGLMVEEIVLVLECTIPEEFKDRVWFLPL